MFWKYIFPKQYRYFESEKGILYCGDAEYVLKLFPSETIDLTVTSPPYDNIRLYGANNDSELNKIWNFDKFKAIAHELYRITKKGGVVVWIVNDQTINGSETGTSFKQALYFKEVCGFYLHDTMIYYKESCQYPDTNRYYQSFEYMFVFSKGKPKTVNLIMDRENKRAGEKIGLSTYREKDGSMTIKKTNRRVKKYGVRFNVWHVSPGFNKSHTDDIAYKHPATFPEQLPHDHIISWSNEDDIILDPMCGSGTTLKMAQLLNRRWIGIEINPEYCNIAKARVELLHKNNSDDNLTHKNKE